MTNTTWNPSDKSSGVTLSGGNLTVSTGTNYAGVRAVGGLTSGKYYFEITCTTWNGNQCQVGLANAGASLGSVSNPGTGIVGVISADGSIYINGNPVGAGIGIGTNANGAIIGIAVDLNGGLAWFRAAPSGNWNGNAAYAPGGSGGVNISTITGAIFPYLTAGFYTSTFTANFGNSAFTGAVPSGFISGFPISAAPPIELSGNIGGYNQYGKLVYGLKPYSWSVIQPTFAANAGSVLGLSGGLAPTVSFSGTAGCVLGVGGNLGPVVSFSAYLSGAVDLGAANLAPQVTLSGSLTATSMLAGNLTPNVVFAASELLSDPLWAESALCPPPMWTDAALCPDPGWIPLTAPGDLVYQSSNYGTANYGAYPYGQGHYVPAVPLPWTPAELCNG